MEHRIDTPPTRKLVMKTMMGSYDQFPEAWPAFMGWAGQQGLFDPEGFAGTIYMTNPMTCSDESEYHTELCMTVPDDYEAPEGYSTGHFPSGKFARITYVGPYEGLGEAWSKAWEIVRENYTHRDAPSFDMYVDNPSVTPPEKLRTELWIPVE